MLGWQSFFSISLFSLEDHSPSSSAPSPFLFQTHLTPPPLSTSSPGLAVSLLQARILQSCSQEIKAEPQKGKETCPRPHSKESAYKLRSKAEVQAWGKDGRCHSFHFLCHFVPSVSRQFNREKTTHTTQLTISQMDLSWLWVNLVATEHPGMQPGPWVAPEEWNKRVQRDKVKFVQKEDGWAQFGGCSHRKT